MPFRKVNEKINPRWFLRVLEQQGVSLNEYDKKLRHGVGRSSRLFRGLIRFQLEDAEDFVRLTGTPLPDVLANAGLAAETLHGVDTIRVRGWIDGERRLHLTTPKRGPQAVLAPPGLHNEALAYVYRTDGTTLAPLDGAVVFSAPLGPIDPTMVGRWCILRTSKEQRIGVLKPGARRGAWAYAASEHDPAIEATIDAAASIEWMQF